MGPVIAVVFDPAQPAESNLHCSSRSLLGGVMAQYRGIISGSLLVHQSPPGEGSTS